MKISNVKIGTKFENNQLLVLDMRYSTESFTFIEVIDLRDENQIQMN